MERHLKSFSDHGHKGGGGTSSTVGGKINQGKHKLKRKAKIVNLQLKVACFVKKKNNVVNFKMRSFKLVSARRSTVLSIPIQ